MNSFQAYEPAKPSSSKRRPPKNFVFINNDDTAAKKSKIQRSCDSCRQRKIRCDAAVGKWPCSHCEKTGAPCSRPAGFDKAIPPPKAPGEIEQDAPSFQTPSIGHSSSSWASTNVSMGESPAFSTSSTPTRGRYSNYSYQVPHPLQPSFMSPTFMPPRQALQPQYGQSYAPTTTPAAFAMQNNLPLVYSMLPPQAHQVGYSSAHLGLRRFPPVPSFAADQHVAPFTNSQGMPPYPYASMPQPVNAPTPPVVQIELNNNMRASQSLEFSNNFAVQEQVEHILSTVGKEDGQHRNSRQGLPHAVSMLVPAHAGQDEPELLIGHVEWEAAVTVPAEHVPEDTATMTIQQISPPSTSPRTRAVFDRDVLASAMGRLGISSHDAVAQYYDQPVRDIPLMEDMDDLVPDTTGVGMKVRIPPDMMPPEEVVQSRLKYFFEHCHPYLPLMVPTEMYSQWADDRDEISPLVLEGIFACCGYCSGDHLEGDKWRAMAERHARYYEDAPRLSTLQGLVILLKANEFRAKGGYHYRNWTSITRIVQMAVDLGLHEHKDLHTRNLCPDEGEGNECIVRTRLWNTIFVLELMIGGAQGRTGFSVDIQSVDLENRLDFPLMTEDERTITALFNQFMRAIRVVRTTNKNWAHLRRTKADWANDVLFIENNKDVEQWLVELPDDLRIDFPADGTLPHIPSHFIANLHCYYYLAVLLQHRPQVELLTREDARYAEEVATCYDAAKRICVLQEALKEKYGWPGLFPMLRGAHFHMYCVVACLMYHLVSLWTLDPRLFPQTREFTERHMRILDDLTSRRPLQFMREKFGTFIDTLNSAEPGELFMLRDDLQPLRLSECPESPPAAGGLDPFSTFKQAPGVDGSSGGAIRTTDNHEFPAALHQDGTGHTHIIARPQSSAPSQSSFGSQSGRSKSSRKPRNSFDVGLESTTEQPMRTQDFNPMPLMTAFSEQFNMGQFYQENSPQMESAEAPDQSLSQSVLPGDAQYGYGHYQIYPPSFSSYGGMAAQYPDSSMVQSSQDYRASQLSVQYGHGSETMTMEDWNLLIQQNMPRKRKTVSTDENERTKNQRRE